MEIVYLYDDNGGLTVSINNSTFTIFLHGIIYCSCEYKKYMRIDLFDIKKDDGSNFFQYRKELKNVYKKRFGL